MKKILILLMFSLPVLTVHGAPAAETTAVLRKTLESCWQNHLSACRSGKASAIQQTMSAYWFGTLKNNLTEAKRELTAELIRSMAEDGPDVLRMRFVRLIENGPTAGLVYVADSEEKDASGKPRVEFAFVKFVKETSGWKADGMMRVGDVKIGKDGKETQFDPSDLPPQLAIDGKVRGAPVTVPVADLRAILDVFSYGYRTLVTVNGIEQEKVEGKSASATVRGGLKKGRNTIKIVFTKIDGGTGVSPGVKVWLVDTKERREVFQYEPKGEIEGTHAFTFDAGR